MGRKKGRVKRKKSEAEEEKESVKNERNIRWGRIKRRERTRYVKVGRNK